MYFGIDDLPKFSGFRGINKFKSRSRFHVSLWRHAQVQKWSNLEPVTWLTTRNRYSSEWSSNAARFTHILLYIPYVIFIPDVNKYVIERAKACTGLCAGLGSLWGFLCASCDARDARGHTHSPRVKAAGRRYGLMFESGRGRSSSRPFWRSDPTHSPAPLSGL